MKASHPSSTAVAAAGVPTRGLPRLLIFLLVTYIVYTVNLVASTRSCDHALPFPAPNRLAASRFLSNLTITLDELDSADKKQKAVVLADKTEIRHVVFGMAASLSSGSREEYIKIWYKPKQMRGVVWMEEPVESHRGDGLPPVKISGDTERFKYTNEHGHRSAIRLSRIVSETLRLGMKDVRWFVMGDDDTVFIADNLVRVLNKHDHSQMYYIGSLSESHLQNIFFSYGMAYGGGGFCISYPLAKALVKVQDGCIQRYPQLYGSDDRMQACMAELGVPLQKEPGFHQDVYGSLFGLLTAHPVAPLVTLHHLDVVEPIFPDTTRVEALKRLFVPAKIDSAGVIQQSICHYKPSLWTLSISWGYAVQIVRGIMTARDMEMPTRAFLNWYRRADYTAYGFNTRPVARNPCQKPFVFYMRNMTSSPRNKTWSRYDYYPTQHPFCKWKLDDPGVVTAVEVCKRSDPLLWSRSPRRNCCRVLELKKSTGTMVVDVGLCTDGEIAALS